MEKASRAMLPTIKTAAVDGINSPYVENLPELFPFLQRKNFLKK